MVHQHNRCTLLLPCFTFDGIRKKTPSKQTKSFYYTEFCNNPSGVQINATTCETVLSSSCFTSGIAEASKKNQNKTKTLLTNTKKHDRNEPKQTKVLTLTPQPKPFSIIFPQRLNISLNSPITLQNTIQISFFVTARCNFF